MPTVVLIGTLDTKGLEFDFIRKRLKNEGVSVILVDAGVLGSPSNDRLRLRIKPDISREQVAQAVGADVKVLADAGDRGAAVMTMARGAAEITRRLFAEKKLHGVMGMGGSGNSSIAAAAAQALPVGVPKLIVSTLASGDTRPYVGASDVTMMYSVVDIAGINRVSERILSNAAAAIAGMAKSYAASRRKRSRASVGKPLIGATMFGVTTPCVNTARAWLEERGYEVLVFHSTGTGGQSMEALVKGGFLAGVLDVTTTELADELVGGVLSAGPERLEAAGAMSLPQVVSLGALDMVNFGPLETVPEKFRGRNLYKHNATVTLMRTTPEENAELGRVIARKLNRATGPVAVFIPTKGVSMIDAVGKPFHDPEAGAALIRELKANLRKGIMVKEMATDINDPKFARAMARELDKMISSTKMS
jgi:uncharacterized protein (UPF0261 family)